MRTFRSSEPGHDRPQLSSTRLVLPTPRLVLLVSIVSLLLAAAFSSTTLAQSRPSGSARSYPTLIGTIKQDNGVQFRVYGCQVASEHRLYYRVTSKGLGTRTFGFFFAFYNPKQELITKVTTQTSNTTVAIPTGHSYTGYQKVGFGVIDGAPSSISSVPIPVTRVKSC